jgi:hypothetical protein
MVRWRLLPQQHLHTRKTKVDIAKTPCLSGDKFQEQQKCNDGCKALRCRARSLLQVSTEKKTNGWRDAKVGQKPARRRGQERALFALRAGAGAVAIIGPSSSIHIGKLTSDTYTFPSHLQDIQTKSQKDKQKRTSLPQSITCTPNTTAKMVKAGTFACEFLYSHWMTWTWACME